MKLPVVLAAAGVVSGLLVTAMVTRPGGPATPRMELTARGQHQGYGPLEFDVDGKPVGGLYPGKVKGIELVVTNPYSVRLRITGLSGRLVSTSRKACPVAPSSLEVRKYTGDLPVVVAPNRTVKLTGVIPLAMPKNTTPKCADTRFKIALTAQGSKDTR